MTNLLPRTAYLTDEQAESLRDNVRPYTSTGDSDTGTAVMIYRLLADVTADGVTIPAGTHVREVSGNNVVAYTVTTVGSSLLDFDTAESFGFDATGTDGDRRFPYTVADAVELLNRRAARLIEIGALTVHDGDLPYVFEIGRSRDPMYARSLLVAFPDLVTEDSDMVGDFLSLSESLFNIDPVSGRVDPSLPLLPIHTRLLALLAFITPEN